MTAGAAYTQLIAFVDRHAVQYRLIDHAPEGRTEIVSPMRGNALSQAAKCIVLMVKIGKKITKYVLGVVPGDARVDLNAVKALIKGTYVSFASSDKHDWGRCFFTLLVDPGHSGRRRRRPTPVGIRGGPIGRRLSAQARAG